STSNTSVSPCLPSRVSSNEPSASALVVSDLSVVSLMSATSAPSGTAPDAPLTMITPSSGVAVMRVSLMNEGLPVSVTASESRRAPQPTTNAPDSAIQSVPSRLPQNTPAEPERVWLPKLASDEREVGDERVRVGMSGYFSLDEG